MSPYRQTREPKVTRRNFFEKKELMSKKQFTTKMSKYCSFNKMTLLIYTFSELKKGKNKSKSMKIK